MTRPALAAVSPLCDKAGCAAEPEPGGELCARCRITRTATENLHQREQAAAREQWATRDLSADRAVLLWAAASWEVNEQDLIANGATPDQAHDVLRQIVEVHTHPAARGELVFLLPALREAVERVQSLELGHLAPSDLIDGPVWGAAVDRRDLAFAQVKRDVAEALAPLLTGRVAGAS